MLRKLVHYLLIVTGNTVILIFLLLLRDDNLEYKLQTDYDFYCALKIILLEALALFFSFLFISILPNITHHRKLKISSGILLLFTAPLYVENIAAIVQNRFIDAKFRNQIADKLSISNNPFKEISGKELNLNEYIFVAKIKSLPKISDQATNIDFKVKTYDTFLGDYSLDVSYNLPKDIKIDKINIAKEGFEHRQYAVIANSKQRVYCTIAEY